MTNNSVDRTVLTSEPDVLIETRPPMVELSAYVNSFVGHTLPTATVFYKKLLAKFSRLKNNSLYHSNFISSLTDWLSSTSPDSNGELNFRDFVEQHAPHLIGENSTVIIEDFVFYPGWFPTKKSQNPQKFIFFADILFDRVCFATCNLHKSSFERTVIIDSSFLGANLDGSAFVSSELNYVDFKGADLFKSEMSNITAIGCRFDDANLEKAKIEDHSSFQGCSFQGANMQKISMEAFTDGNDLFGATLKKAGFSCDTVFETGQYLILGNAATLARNYANYFPGSPRNDGSICGQDHENKALYLQTLSNSSTPSSLVPAFVCGTRFDGALAGKNTVFFNATGKDGRAALGSQGASIPDMSISVCSHTPAIIFACIFFGIPLAWGVLSCLPDFITWFGDRIMSPDIPAAAGNNPNANAEEENVRAVVVELGESPSCRAGVSVESTPLLVSPSAVASPSSHSPAKIRPVTNQERYEHVFNRLEELERFLKPVPQKISSSLTAFSAEEKMPASPMSFFNLQEEKQQKKLLKKVGALAAKIEKEKDKYSCVILATIMDNPAFVEGEALCADYSALLQQVNSQRRGLVNTPATPKKIQQALHMKGLINEWLEGIERELEGLETEFADIERKKEASSFVNLDPTHKQTEMRNIL